MSSPDALRVEKKGGVGSARCAVTSDGLVSSERLSSGSAVFYIGAWRTG